MTDPNTDTREAPPPVDLRPHTVAYLANNLRTNGYEHHARTMEALADLRASDKPSDADLYACFAADLGPGGAWVLDGARTVLARYGHAAPQASADPTRAMLDGKPLDGEFAKVMADKFDEICIRPAAEDSAKGAGSVALPPIPESQGYIPKTLANGEIVEIAAVSQYRAIKYARAAVLADRQQRGADALHNLVAEKFSSGNAIPVERITITRTEWDAALAATKGESNE